MTFSGLELGWVGSDERVAAGLLVLLFAPLLQTLASVFAFLARDAVTATAMGTLAGSWLVTGVVVVATAPAATSDALGVFLFMPGAALLATSITAMQVGKLLPAAVLATTGARFIFSAIYGSANHGAHVERLGGGVRLPLQAQSHAWPDDPRLPGGGSACRLPAPRRASAVARERRPLRLRRRPRVK